MEIKLTIVPKIVEFMSHDTSIGGGSGGGRLGGVCSGHRTAHICLRLTVGRPRSATVGNRTRNRIAHASARRSGRRRAAVGSNACGKCSGRHTGSGR